MRNTTLAICCTLVLVSGCGAEDPDLAQANAKQVIRSQQQAKLPGNQKLITDQQTEIIVGTYQTTFITEPALSSTRLKGNAEEKKPRINKTTAEARDLRVDPDIGDDSNDGSTSPLKSIRQAIRIAKAGDTIHLNPVVYHQYAGF